MFIRPVKSHAFRVRLTHFGPKWPLTPAGVSKGICLTHSSYQVISPYLLDPQESMTYQIMLKFHTEAISALFQMIQTELIGQKLIYIIISLIYDKQ